MNEIKFNRHIAERCIEFKKSEFKKKNRNNKLHLVSQQFYNFRAIAKEKYFKYLHLALKRTNNTDKYCMYSI